MRHAFALLLVTIIGCDRATQFAQRTGLATAAPPPPEQIEVMCDSGHGSTCTQESLAMTMGVILPYVASRPGSVVRLWSVADDPADSRMIAERQSTAPKRAGVKARRAHEKRFIEESRVFFTTAARPLFEQTQRQSTPLFESLTRVALTTATRRRQIVLISDLREETPRTARTECGPLPKNLDALHERGILTPALLKNTTVHLSFVSFERVENDRCPADIGRFAQLQNLWRDALVASGATVHITSEAPEL